VCPARMCIHMQALYDSIPDPHHVVEFGSRIEQVITTPAPTAQPTTTTTTTTGAHQHDGNTNANSSNPNSSSNASSSNNSSSSSKGNVAVQLADGRTVYGSALVGADGVGSLVAGGHLGLSRPGYAGYVAFRGVADFPCPSPSPGVPTPPNSLPIPTDTVRQIWGRGVRAGMYPLTPSSCYWFVCYNEDEQAASRPPATPSQRQSAALSRVAHWAGQWGLAAAIRCTPPDDITWSRIADRWTPGPFGRGVVTLAGDAAHPMTPNLGQGGCAALEDAVVLGRLLG
ncbi:hypothetical protein Agub_g6772, partial [Astrephomene gubernaculifera]